MDKTAFGGKTAAAYESLSKATQEAGSVLLSCICPTEGCLVGKIARATCANKETGTQNCLKAAEQRVGIGAERS